MSDTAKQLPIRVIVGLGNPGRQYEETRHNAGFWFVDLIARRCDADFRSDNKFHGMVARVQIGGDECWLLKPTTFMNRSGQAVSSLAKYYKISLQQILVVHDELDMAAGIARLKYDGGHAGHNGLRDIIAAMGGRDFWRLRIGIDRPAASSDVVNYVLARPSKEDASKIEVALDDAERVLPDLMVGQYSQAMNRLHTLSPG